ncbi:MAG: arginase family protein, partial [Thermoplasmata archaeon]
MKTLSSLPRGHIAMVGFPLDENSSYLKGAALGPAKIREALTSGSANMTTELGVDLGSATGWTDVGDVSLPPGHAALDVIDATITAILDRGARALSTTVFLPSASHLSPVRLSVMPVMKCSLLSHCIV